MRVRITFPSARLRPSGSLRTRSARRFCALETLGEGVPLITAVRRNEQGRPREAALHRFGCRVLRCAAASCSSRFVCFAAVGRPEGAA